MPLGPLRFTGAGSGVETGRVAEAVMEPPRCSAPAGAPSACPFPASTSPSLPGSSFAAPPLRAATACAPGVSGMLLLLSRLADKPGRLPHIIPDAFYLGR